MTRKPRVLTKVELSVMRVIWDAHPEPLTVRRVVDLLNESQPRPLAYTSVQTMMRILKDKGFLDVRPGPGRAHAFRARVTWREVASGMVGDLVERLFDGHATPLLTSLLDHGSVTRDELEDLKRLIETQLDDPEATT